MEVILRIAIPLKSNSFKITTSNSGETIVSGGIDAHFLEILVKKLRRKYTVIVERDGEWGSLVDGNWTGLVGLIYRGEADIAMGTLGITEDRLKAVDFSYPYQIKEITFVTQPPAMLTREYAFIMPFTKDIWLGILALLILLPFVFRILFPKKYLLGNLLMKVVGILLRQSTTLDIRAGRQKVIFAAWLMGTSILSLIYSSLLLSFLTVPLRESGIEDRRQLSQALKDGSVKCATVAGTSFQQRLASSFDESTRKIGTYIKNNKWIVSNDDESLSEYIYRGKTALIMSRDKIKMTFLDNVFISKDYFFSSYIAVAIDKSFRYKNELNRIIHEIAATGLYEKDEEDFLFRKRLLANRTGADDHSPKQLSVSDLKGNFILLILGHILASAAFLLEVLHKRLKKCRLKHAY